MMSQMMICERNETVATPLQHPIYEIPRVSIALIFTAERWQEISQGYAKNAYPWLSSCHRSAVGLRRYS
jgi:hypothetical protein